MNQPPAEWAPGPPAVRGPPSLRLAAAIYVPLAAAAVAGWLAGGLVWGAIAGAAALVLLWVRLATVGRSALRSARARPAGAGEAERAAVIAADLAPEVDVPAPAIWIAEAGGPNALAVRAPTPIIAITAPLLETYSGTELEAVIAHCLVRLRPRLYGPAREVAALGRLAPAVKVVDERLDAAAAAITRFPPALASAIEGATPTRGAHAALWFVADSKTHVDAGTRAQALRDL